jgi:hypothetical protein
LAQLPVPLHQCTHKQIGINDELLLETSGNAAAAGGEHSIARAIRQLVEQLDLSGLSPSFHTHRHIYIFPLLLPADATRVGLLHYGKSVGIPVSLGGYHERHELLAQVGQMASNAAASANANDLGAQPDISAAYRAAIQQFNSFGRQSANVPRVLLLFTSGEDMLVAGRGGEVTKVIPINLSRFPDSSSGGGGGGGHGDAKHSLGQMGVFLLLLGPSNYDAEIGEESAENILLDKVEAAIYSIILIDWL